MAAGGQAFAIDTEYSLSQNGLAWPQMRMAGVSFRELSDQRRRLELSGRSTAGADLSLPFEAGQEWRAYNYSLIRNAPTLSQAQSRSGTSAGAFYGENPLQLQPGAGALFNLPAGDFSIDFWVFPTRLAEGEELFSYKADIAAGNRLIQQLAVCAFENGRISWRFENIFYNAEGQSVSVSLRSGSVLKGRWRRHTLRFKNDLGLLEILDDGVVAAVAYANRAGRETSELFEPRWQLGQNQTVQIGSFAGYLDDFNVFSRYVPQLQGGRFAALGQMVTPPIDLKGTRFKSAKIVGDAPESSSFRTYVRFGSSRPALEEGSLPWRPYEPGSLYTGDTARFVQFKIEFYAGPLESSSPSLQDFIIVREILPPPPAPLPVSFSREANGVMVRWQPLLAAGIKGYKLYFGEESGDYFGLSAAGSSPIDVGEATELFIEGLKPGKLYYFSLTAYDGGPVPQESAFAPERVFLP